MLGVGWRWRLARPNPVTTASEGAGERQAQGRSQVVRPVDLGLKLVPAYATTVHKAQGSEYPAVGIPLVTQHWSMLRRNLVYTAITRGKRLVVVVGQPNALAIAVRGARARRRWSKLGEWLGSAPRATS